MTVEHDLAILDKLWRHMGLGDELRAELSAECCEIASLALGDPDQPRRGLLALVLVLPFVEGYVREGGDDELGDAFARVTAAASLWLELPAELVAFAGLPLSESET